MRKSFFKIITLTMFLFTTACVGVEGKNAYLYPKGSNICVGWGDCKSTPPVLYIEFHSEGKAIMNRPNGDVLTGQYDFLKRGREGYGKILSYMYNPGGSGQPNTMYPDTRNEGFGEVTLHGKNNSLMQCEFYYDPTQGWGVCQDSNGEHYRLNF